MKNPLNFRKSVLLKSRHERKPAKKTLRNYKRKEKKRGNAEKKKARRVR